MRVRITFEMDVPDETLVATVQSAAQHSATAAVGVVEADTSGRARAGRVRASIFANRKGRSR